MSWEPPSSFEERLKRSLIPPRWELARIVRRELKKGEAELRLVPFLAMPDRIALDIGANRGIWTHILSRHVPHVIAFEPNPKMFRVLERALPDNAEARAVALSDTQGVAQLEVPQRNGGWSNQHASLNPHRNEGLTIGKVAVEMCPLDTLDLPPVGFMKIDVEGHETAVINGARALIARDKPRLIIELEERHTGQPIREAVADIESLGYQALFLRHGALHRIDDFVPDRDHLGVEDTPAYVNNFIFLPH